MTRYHQSSWHLHIRYPENTIRQEPMPRTYSSIDKIRAELAWVNEAPDPNKCGCRNVRYCDETGGAASSEQLPHGCPHAILPFPFPALPGAPGSMPSSSAFLVLSHALRLTLPMSRRN